MVKKMITYFLVALLLMVGTLIVKDYLSIKSSKLHIMRNDILKNYYDQNKLELLARQRLGDKYIGELEKDFDHYVISLVMDDLKSLEDEKLKRYNDFLTESRVKEIKGGMKEEAGDLLTEAINDHTYLLSIGGFYNGITSKKLKPYLGELKSYPHLIIDLRGNTGGTVKELKEIASLFLGKEKVIYQLRNSERTKSIVSDNTTPFQFERIVILTNGMTASTAELFILALKDNLPHVSLIGTPTYGKPVSFAFRQFIDGSGMIFINDEMLGPMAEEISIDGIQPDIWVGRTEAEYEQIEDEKLREQARVEDERLQMEAAVKQLES